MGTVKCETALNILEGWGHSHMGQAGFLGHFLVPLHTFIGGRSIQCELSFLLVS